MSPSSNIDACSGVNTADPSIGEFRPEIFARLICTPALAPAAAGPWKCAAIAGPESPENCIDQVSWLLDESNVIVADPVALLSTGGTTCELSRDAVHEEVAAYAGIALVEINPNRKTKLNGIASILGCIIG